MEWVRVWQVTITWQPWAREPYSTVVRNAHTSAELRNIIEWARGNPRVLRHAEKSMRVLDGEAPKACPAGHTYPTGAGHWSRFRRWRVCGCGGHFELTCPHCGDITIEPPVSYDCD